MKLWKGSSDIDKTIESFTIGKDREMDLLLAGYDVLGSLAHTLMLEKAGLLSGDEKDKLVRSLRSVYKDIDKDKFKIEEGVEDVHSQIELLLTAELGDTGKKIHTGRSRNDQVLVDIRMFTRQQLKEIVNCIETLFGTLIKLSNTHKHILLPGYTHLQVAMPSSFGLWFGAYAESLADDLIMLQAAYEVNNKNPLGSAAGYGTGLPIDRTYTTKLLGFDDLNYNVVYAQMGRGKSEFLVSTALASVAQTLNKLATDACLYMNQNFNFISFPEYLTTGSSIMPHKRNPDVFELIRARSNKLRNLPNDILLLTGNLPSGYFRDLQLLKESYLPAFKDLIDCLKIANHMLENIVVNDKILESGIYDSLFTVESVNELVKKGIPFREAYHKVSGEVKEGTFQPKRMVDHTHEGSIGYLCNDKIEGAFKKVLKRFDFSWEEALERLIRG